MIRLILLSTGFIGITASLLWTLGAPPQPQEPLVNEVSRSEPAPLAITPVIAPTQASTRPQARPVTISAPEPAPRPVVQTPVIRQAATSPSGDQDEVANALRAMAYGIVNELKKPAPAGTKPAAAPAPTFAGQTYTVQDGDSLNGIAFRFFGTTVAYLEILAANEDVLTDPAQLTAGMVLRIPDRP